MLKHLHAKQGQEVFAIETPCGYSLAALDKGVREQVEVGEAFMDRHCDVFDGLAKQRCQSDPK
jgi:protein-L-isoaspartate O-methyltransferase